MNDSVSEGWHSFDLFGEFPILCKSISRYSSRYGFNSKHPMSISKLFNCMSMLQVVYEEDTGGLGGRATCPYSPMSSMVSRGLAPLLWVVLFLQVRNLPDLTMAKFSSGFSPWVKFRGHPTGITYTFEGLGLTPWVKSGRYLCGR